MQNVNMTVSEKEDLDTIIAGIGDVSAEEKKEASEKQPEPGKKKSGIEEILEWLSN